MWITTKYPLPISTDSFWPFVPPVGQSKVQVAKERIRDIDDEIIVHTYEVFYNEDTEGMFDFHAYDYIVDAIDTVTSKLLPYQPCERVPCSGDLLYGHREQIGSVEI